MIFDYATKYRSSHPTIAPAKEFHLTDQEYLDFTTWLNGKDYDYTTRSEKLMEDLKKTAIREKEYDDAKADFDALKQKLSHNGRRFTKE